MSFQCRLPPQPFEMNLSGLHDFILHGIYIIVRDIAFAVSIAMRDKRTAEKLDEVRLVSRQLPDLLNSKRVILYRAFDRFCNELPGSLLLKPGKFVMARNVEEDRPVASRKLFNRVSS